VALGLAGGGTASDASLLWFPFLNRWFAERQADAGSQRYPRHHEVIPAGGTSERRGIPLLPQPASGDINAEKRTFGKKVLLRQNS